MLESGLVLSSTRDRVIYLNDALSGIHGPKMRAIAQDIYRSRKAIYESNRRKMNDTNLQNYLEQKADDFVKQKYHTKYGLFEGGVGPGDYKLTNDIWVEKANSKQMSMGDSIRILREINAKMASGDLKKIVGSTVPNKENSKSVTQVHNEENLGLADILNTGKKVSREDSKLGKRQALGA